jgi:CBS domain-containing protein
MRLADVIDNCTVRTVTVMPGLSLAEATRAMHKADCAALLVMDNDLVRGILTAGDILRILTSGESVNLVWNGPTTAGIFKELPNVSTEEKVAQVIEKMTAAGIEYLPVHAGGTTRVVSLCRLLRAHNTYLHGEVFHLQTYIDALHDAPND